MWPKSDAQSMSNFYGTPWKVTDSGIVVNPTFEAIHITRIKAPYDMWIGDIKISRISVNKRCADSLLRVLTRISKEISPIERKEFHLDRYGGGFNFRPIRGAESGRLAANKLSTHAYGAAIDLAPDLNPIGAFYTPGKRMMPHEVIEMFKKEGWAWGGDFKTRPDCMHFQATS